MSDSAYIILIKYPQAGKVKTRLGQSIGDQKAAEFYKALVENLLSSHSGVYDTLLFIQPYDKLSDFEAWLGNSYKYFAQRGADIGEIMFNALSDAFNEGYSKVVLTGSDIPELNGDIINEAFQKLSDTDAVIGESEDGGYYLIGFNNTKLDISFFTDIKWSSDIVFSETLNIFKKANLSFSKTKKLLDIDTVADLKRLNLKWEKPYDV
ncbi:MAG: hypothetical protein C0602_13470 [Denitrovibrio sp.]|nr:MAG: hypothetical protein C0602_13470 [Denitrovibrio sp.]